MRTEGTHTANFLAQHRLVRGLFDRDRIDNSGVPGTTIERLGYYSLKLSRALNETDRSNTRNINGYFYYNDSAALGDLNQVLHNPIDAEIGRIIKWLAIADIDDLAKFTSWNANRTQAFTDALYRDSANLKNLSLGAADKLIKAQFFPNESMGIIHRAICNTTLAGMDSFETGGQGANGIYNPGEKGGLGKISLANQYTDRINFHHLNDNFCQTIVHENLHAAGDGLGLFYGIDQKDGWYRAIDEAFVEHSTVSAFAPLSEPHIINPDNRTPGQGDKLIYKQERRFLGTLADGAGVPAHQLAEAYFSDIDDRAGYLVRHDMAVKFGKFLGSPNRLNQIMERYESLSSHKRGAYLRRVIRRL